MVLVVEDNRAASEALAALLRLSGYGVDTADDGIEALAYLRGNPPPFLVLLDLVMPRMGGREFLAAKAADPALAPAPVVILSAVADPRATPPDGAVAVEAKPVCLGRLLEVLERFGRAT